MMTTTANRSARRWLLSFSALAALLVTGCAKDAPLDKVDADRISRADQLKAEKNRFDTAADAPISANTHFAAGQLAETQGDLENAVHQYNEALRLDTKNVQSLYHLGQDPRLNHEFPVRVGVRAEQCAGLLRSFFADRR